MNMPRNNRKQAEIDEDPWKLLDQSKKEFAEQYPAIFAEISGENAGDSARMRIDEVQADIDQSDDVHVPSGDREHEQEKDPLARYEPGVLDFLQRASTKEEAEEVIHFLVDREEITSKLGDQLLNKLEVEGLTAFGPHRSPGHYDRTSMKELQKRLMRQTPIRPIEDEEKMSIESNLRRTKSSNAKE